LAFGRSCPSTPTTVVVDVGDLRPSLPRLLKLSGAEGEELDLCDGELELIVQLLVPAAELGVPGSEPIQLAAGAAG
jgi:hypothetical protein